ncbi:MAG: DUF4476 domain-containing protein [Flavobacteriia bacterium]
MKLITSILFSFVSLISIAQSNLTIFNNGGQQFYAILNGIKQNSQPQTNVYISGIKNGGYSLKIIFADGKTADVDKNLFIDAPSDITTRITFKKGKGKLQLVSLVATEGVIAPGAVVYRPSDAAVYSDAVVQTTTVQTTTTQTTNGTANAQVPTNGNMNVNTTGMSQTQSNQNGNVGMNVNVNTTGTGMTQTQSTSNGNANFNMNVSGSGMDPNMQNGSVGISINVSGMDPNMQNGNMGVNMNVNATGMEQQVNPNANVNMNVNANGMNTQQTTGQTTITTTTTTTNSGGNVNYQTNNQLNQANAQSNVNTSGALIACNRTLNNLPTFLEELKDQSFEDDRLEAVKLALKNTCLTADQAGKIIELYSFDDNKLEVAKFLSDRLIDRENATSLAKFMSFDSSKMEYRKYVASH